MAKIDKELLKKNALLILFSIALFIIFVYLAITAVFTSFIPQSKQLPRPVVEGGGTGGSEDTTAQGKEITRKESLVGNLIDKTPYKGKNFSFYYSFTKSEFILYIPLGKESAGNLEFDSFLKQNGVESREWIRHLSITNAQPSL